MAESDDIVVIKGVYDRTQSYIDYKDKSIEPSLQDFITQDGQSNMTRGKQKLVENVIRYHFDEKVPVEKANPDLINDSDSPIKTEIDKDIYEKTSDAVRRLSEKYDFAGLKRLKFESSRSQEDLENVTYNRAKSRVRDLKDAKDINGLESFKKEIQGIRDEDEVRQFIDMHIKRIQGL